MSELREVLERHAWSFRLLHLDAAASVATADHADVALPEAPDRVPILAANRIDDLRTNLPPATFASLIEDCLIDMDNRLPALRRALVAGAPAAVTAHAHALVGMAAGYGMAALEARLRTIMAASRDGELAALGPAIVHQVEADFAEAAIALREMVRREVV
jgi:hypothetical protein